MKNLMRLFFLLSFMICNTAFADEGMQYPLMKFSFDEMKANNEKNFMALRAVSELKAYGPKHLDLSQYVSTKGKIRNQENCSNCWVWAGLGALEIRKNVLDGLSSASPNNSFSVGFVNSFYNNGGRSGNFACNGGTTNKLTQFFSKGGEANQRIIPWSNENAGFFDGDGGTPYKGGYVSNRLKEDIDISPYYLISNITNGYLDVSSLNTNQVIQALKYQLNNKQPLVLAFFLPTSADWDFFYNFWGSYSEDSWIDLGYRAASTSYESTMMGHAVLIVGYDDRSSDVNDHYWIALNTWGVPDNRPNGTFRIKMNTNYKSYISWQGENFYKMQWYVLDPVFASQKPYVDKKQISGKLVDVNGSGVKDVAVKFNNQDIALTDSNGLFSFSGGEAGQKYTLEFSRAGYKFTPDTYLGKVDKKYNYIEVGVVNDPAYAQCKGSAVAIKNVGKSVDAIKKLSKTAINKMKSKGNSSEVLENLVRTYNNAFNSYPRVVYKCPSSCGNVSYSSNKAELKKAITKIAQGAISNWNKCVKQKKVKAKVFKQKKKLIVAKRNAALKQLAKLQTKGALCK